MNITTSNVLLGVTPIITFGASSDAAANVTDPYFSTVYNSSSPTTLTLIFNQQSNISYVAIAGHNIQDLDRNASVEVWDGPTLIKRNRLLRTYPAVMTFEERDFTNMVVQLKSANNVNPVVSFVAAGQYFEVPNSGEVAGYNRQYLNRSYKQKTTTSNLAAPVSVLRKKVPAKGTLNLPNMTKNFTGTTWQTFLDFAEENHFFIQEIGTPLDTTDATNSSAYLCYNILANSVKAHPQTRALNNVSVSFNVLNGL